MTIDLAPLSEAVLAELWFGLRNKTWRAVTGVVKASGADQKQLAARIDMDPGQFSRVIAGKAGNVTLRTLHNIARAADHRLKISLEPLADLPKPKYNYDFGKRGRDPIERTTDTPVHDAWTREVKSGDAKRLEPVQ
jgi:transcriptional regulator with XRE-family HTH domain